MRRLLLVTLLLLSSATALFALYVIIDIDPDRLSPIVEAPTYRAMFESAVERRSGTAWTSLDQQQRAGVLDEIVASGEADPVREVALYELRGLADKDRVASLLMRQIPSLQTNLFEVAVTSLAALRLPAADAWLDSMYNALEADPAAHTPLGGYRTSSLVLSRDTSGIDFNFAERSRTDADYALNTAEEISLFFPDNPIWFAAIPNADDLLGEFEESDFVSRLDGSPVPEDAWKLPMLRVIHSLRERLDESLGVLSDQFSPEKLFRDNLLIANYDGEYLIASFKDKNVTVAEAMIGAFETLGGNFGIRRWKVGTETVAAVSSTTSGRTLAYATPGDYFIVATDTALIERALETFNATGRENSLGIDPLFREHYMSVDKSGATDVLFAWFDPSRYFDVTGSESPAARRLAVLSRTLSRRVTHTSADAALRTQGLWSIPGMTAVATVGGDDPTDFWRYVVDVRSLGDNPIDSLARLAGMDVGKAVMSHLQPTVSLGYGGIDFLERNYGFSHTGFNLVAVAGLDNPPEGFDTTMRSFLSRITSLVYTRDTNTGTGRYGSAVAWIAHDTTTNDTMLLERKLQPSFAVVDSKFLVVASTPSMLQSAIGALTSRAGMGPATGDEYLSGGIRVDSMAIDAIDYMKRYLLRTNRFEPDAVAERLDPLAEAIRLYASASWRFREVDGLRVGDGALLRRDG